MHCGSYSSIGSQWNLINLEVGGAEKRRPAFFSDHRIAREFQDTYARRKSRFDS